MQVWWNTNAHPEGGGGELAAVGLLLKVTGGGGALGTVAGGGLAGGGAVTSTVVADEGGLVVKLELEGDCGAYQGCMPIDCIQAILSHRMVCQLSSTKPPVSPAKAASGTVPS